MECGFIAGAWELGAYARDPDRAASDRRPPLRRRVETFAFRFYPNRRVVCISDPPLPLPDPQARSCDAHGLT